MPEVKENCMTCFLWMHIKIRNSYCYHTGMRIAKMSYYFIIHCVHVHVTSVSKVHVCILACFFSGKRIAECVLCKSGTCSYLPASLGPAVTSLQVWDLQLPPCKSGTCSYLPASLGPAVTFLQVWDLQLPPCKSGTWTRSQHACWYYQLCGTDCD